jgi:hypothetical protein
VEKEKKYIMMEAFIKENIMKDNKVEKEFFKILKEIFMKEISIMGINIAK